MSQLLDILSKIDLPSHPIGLISDHTEHFELYHLYDCLRHDLPNLKLYVLSEHIKYPIHIDNNTTQIPYAMLPKYRFGGLPIIDMLDFAILAGVPHKIKPWLWGHVKLGGYALDMHIGDECKPLSFMLDGWPEDAVSAQKTKWVMVSGCFRGATTYISDVLRAVGMDVHRQNYGRDGIASGANIGCRYPEGAIAIHQVREPLATIASLTPKIKKIEEGIMPFMHFSHQATPLFDAMYYYYMVNYTASERGIWTYRVEDIDNVWGKIQRRVGFKAKLPDISRMRNSRNYERPDLTWDSLHQEDSVLAELIEEQAGGYGYDIP